MPHILGFPNTALLLGACITGFGLALLTIHSSTPNVIDPKKKRVSSTRSVVKKAQLVGATIAILGLFLGSRVAEGNNGSYLSSEALTKSYWALFRICWAFIAGANVYIIELHWTMRIIEIFMLTVLVTIDSASEVYFAGQVDCAEQNLCDRKYYVWDLLYVLRDLGSICLVTALVATLFWATIHMGFFENLIVLPKEEHRAAESQKEVETALRDAMDLKDYDLLGKRIKEAEKAGMRSATLEEARAMVYNARAKLS